MFTILHEFLGRRKLFSKCVQRFLTPDQKQQSVEDSERCLELFERGKKGFLRRYVTIDETWIYHYTPETKRSSAEWTRTAAGESRPKRPKTQQWAGKVMASVFWNAHGILISTILRKIKPLTATITRGVSWNLPVLLIDVARDMYTFLWFGIYVIFFYGQWPSKIHNYILPK